MRCEISTHEETIERLQDKIQTIQNDHSRELMQLEAKHRSELNRKETEHVQETTRLKNRIAWQSHIIGCLSFLLLKTSDIFRKAVHSIIRFARDYYKSRFDTEQVYDIKNALNLFGDDRQSHQAAGDFLYFTARQRVNLTTGSKSKPDGKLTMWWKGIMTSSRKEVFDEKIIPLSYNPRFRSNDRNQCRLFE